MEQVIKFIAENIKAKNEVLFYFGAFCFLAAMVCAVLIYSSSMVIAGVNAWLKPCKFFISIGIFVWTMAIYLYYLENKHQVAIYSYSITCLLAIELLCIVFQAARGRASHFNIQTGSDRFIATTMGVSILVAMLHTSLMVVLFFKQRYFNVNDNIVLAIKLSLLIMILFSLEGFVMVAFMGHSVGKQDGSARIPLLNWSKKNGDLRVAHFLGIHALQLIPTISYLMANSKRAVYAICVLYFLFVTFTLIQALQAKPFIK